jgi:hypothetical protein
MLLVKFVFFFMFLRSTFILLSCREIQ